MLLALTYLGVCMSAAVTDPIAIRIAEKVEKNLRFSFNYNGRNWVLLSGEDIDKVANDIYQKINPLIGAEEKRGDALVRMIAGEFAVEDRNFNVLTGLGFRMSGLSELYYKHTCVRKWVTLKAWWNGSQNTMSEELVRSDEPSESMLWQGSLPSDKEIADLVHATRERIYVPT